MESMLKRMQPFKTAFKEAANSENAVGMELTRMCCLGYMTPKQFGEESMKANPRPLPPDQCLHLPMIVYKTQGEMITK